MFKWLHHYFTARKHTVHDVSIVMSLQFEEYPRGVFRPYLHTPGDLRMRFTEIQPNPEVRIFEGGGEVDRFIERVGWKDVVQHGSYFTAPTPTRLKEALRYIVIEVRYQGNR